MYSAFDIFKVGIGPSSSHTTGPMRAAKRFATRVKEHAPSASSVAVELFGSLGHTGRGHGSDKAVILGLQGYDPESVDVDAVDTLVAQVTDRGRVKLLGEIDVAFKPKKGLVFHKRKTLPGHPNGMRFSALDDAGDEILERVYYSIGGGFVVDEAAVEADEVVKDQRSVRHPFTTGEQLLEHCETSGKSISTVMLENELAWRTEEETRAGLLELWGVMQACIERGCRTEGILPGGLKVKRRACASYRKLQSRGETEDPLELMDWVNLFALAVNEENAAGGRVVTAPTNGAAGVLPAVLQYYVRFLRGADDDGVVRFLLAAAAIAIIFKVNASISGAEVGCQGEVGVACSMAAAGLAEVRGGTALQVENAAEIGMEHNLGLTCDPIGGLVQVPCIERNAMGAVKAINAARLALQGDGSHKVSLDKIVRTMRQTGADMSTKYKETARGGLAVNIIEC
ncbi:MAG: L-serine ammonia-lyase [Myxococcota bacterium]